VVAISGDSPFCHAAFMKARNLPFPLLSDVHRTAIRAYGVHDVDRDGVLRWGQAGDREMVRDGREILRVLDVIEGLRRKR
jgi:peroxiredoxin